MALAVRFFDQKKEFFLFSVVAPTFMKVGHAHRIVPTCGRSIGVNRTSLRGDKGTAILFAPQFQLHAGHIRFLQVGGYGILGDEFVARDIESLAQDENIVRGKNNLDIMATGRETAHPGMAGKLQSGVEGKFLRQNVGGVFIGGLEKLGFILNIFITRHGVPRSAD
jgi:hypothetical protein